MKTPPDKRMTRMEANMTTSGEKEKGLLNDPCPDCKSTDKRIRYAMRRCGNCGHDFPLSRTPSHETVALVEAAKLGIQLLPKISCECKKCLLCEGCDAEKDAVIGELEAALKNFKAAEGKGANKGEFFVPAGANVDLSRLRTMPGKIEFVPAAPSVDDAEWLEEKSDELCDDMMDEFLYGGNAGKLPCICSSVKAALLQAIQRGRGK